LKVKAPSGDSYARIKQLRRGLGLATVCEEARCPNIGECWDGGTATFMVLGDTCTRLCRFCNVKTGNPRGVVDPEEPANVARAVSTMELGYVVLTMVDRDDIPDGGADHLNRCVVAMKAASPDLKVEVLMGDFRARREHLATVAHGPADVLAHNVETVRELTPRVRDPKCGYEQSLDALRILKEEQPEKLSKSSIMLGLGESEAQVRATLRDLRAVGVDIVTLGQYLQPSPRHLEVTEFIPPERFAAWRSEALEMGFLFCAAAPLVRSSYKAGELFAERWLRSREAEEATRTPGES
jgi:lipoic acid synthetase